MKYTTCAQQFKSVLSPCHLEITEKKMQRKQPSTTTETALSMGPNEVLTVAETAALLKVPPSSIYEWTRFRGGNRGTPLPHRKVGKYLRFLRSEIDAWLVGLPQAANTQKRQYVRKGTLELKPVKTHPRKRVAA
jgi:predicted DNA-binding transcriptional regulator AlpA